MMSVDFSEMNIAVTEVFLKARCVNAGYPKPLAVELCLPGTQAEEAAWRKAAIEHLEQAALRKKAPPRKKVDWEEINEELDWDERRAR